MVDINSPLGRMQFAKEQAIKSQKVLTIPDESETFDHAENMQQRQRMDLPAPDFSQHHQTQQEQDFNDYQAKRRELINNKNKISKESKKRIEGLAGLGRCYEEFSVAGKTFHLQSLKSNEMRQALQFIMSCTNNVDKSFETKYQVLARAIYAIDETELSFLGYNSFEDVYEMVSEFDELVVLKLYDCYTKMIDENRKNLFIDSEAEAKEVAAEIKK